MEETIKKLVEQKVFEIKDGSAELFFDDLGLLQEVIFRTKRRKRMGEKLVVKDIVQGTAYADYKDGEIMQVRYETRWRRPRQIA